MKHLSLSLLFVLIMILVVGCVTLKANLYPVQGPLLDEGIAGPLPAEFSWDGSGHGQVTMVMPGSGEVLTGEYSTIDNTQYGTAYGGFFSQQQYQQFFGSMQITNGMQRGQAIAVGNKGTSMQIEYWTSLSSHGFGLASDNHGNIYKLMF